MQLQHAIRKTFRQLAEILDQLSDAQFIQPSKTLFGASIGQHIRHIIEVFICLEKGYASGQVSYDKRSRDRRIETDAGFAKDLLFEIAHNLDKADKALLLECSSETESNETTWLQTNYHRELLYNLEHTVHHMALIRVGVNEISAVEVPQEFGMAAATLKYKGACAP
jgi:uncharacterized damage-inducible protein DinB